MSSDSRLYNPDIFDDHHWSAELTPRERLRLEKTSALVPADASSILDVGCGDGRLLRALVSRGYSGRSCGCDTSPGAVVRVDGPSLLAPCDRLPFANASFDCVVCSEVFEHLPTEVLHRAVAEILRVSARYVFVTVPFDERLDEALAKCPACQHEFNVYGHIQSFDQERLVGLFDGVEVLDAGVVSPNIVRRYNKGVLWMKQRALGCWAWAESMVCPQCDNREFPKNNRRPLRVATGIANRVLHPRMTSGGWLYLLARKKSRHGG